MLPFKGAKIFIGLHVNFCMTVNKAISLCPLAIVYAPGLEFLDKNNVVWMSHPVNGALTGDFKITRD